jgi:hypothetical protein
MNHQYMTGKDCTTEWEERNIIDGGLSLCKVCGLFEGSLTTDCPGEKVSGKKGDEIYAGKIDYRDSEGWVNKKNPTNEMWERWKDIRLKEGALQNEE